MDKGLPTFQKAQDYVIVGKDNPPPPGGPGGATSGGASAQSCDPNEISGMIGLGDAGTQRFVKPGEWLDYTVYFENKSTAAAPAQEVWVMHNLSKWLDWSTLELGEIGFNNQIQLELKGKARGTAMVPQTGTNYHVQMNAAMDEATGEFTLYLRSYDKTRQAYGYWPESVYAGFLPPNDGTHRGEGHVTFRVKVKDGAPDGAFINAEATIVFDANDPITTSPAWFNWVTTQENPVADNSTLRWDTSGDANGTTYVVNYWSGDPDPTAPGTTITFNSDTLTKGSWKIADGLAVGRWYWNVTKTNGDESSKTSTWSFDILATHTLTVNGGIGGGMYRTNTRVTAEANTVEGKIFTGWTAVGLDMSEAELSEKRLVFYMPDNDVTLTANYKSDTETQTLELLKGWNWVGFSVLPEDKKYGSVLGSAGFRANDRINGKAGSATFNGSLWLPNRYEIEFGKMYNIYVSNPVTLEVTGLPADMAAVEVVQGWNWISNPTETAVEPSELVHSAGFQPNDRISGKSGSVTFNGSKWMGTRNFRLEPGKGYKLYTNRPGTVRFAAGE